MILGKNAGKALDRVNGQVRKGAFEAVDQFWRGRGAVGRLHNLVRYIRRNPQRQEAFADCKEGGKSSGFDSLNVSLPLSTFGHRSICGSTNSRRAIVLDAARGQSYP